MAAALMCFFLPSATRTAQANHSSQGEIVMNRYLNVGKAVVVVFTLVLFGRQVFATSPAGVQLSPVKLTFRSQVLGTVSAPKLVTVSNTTEETVTLDSITISGDFDIPGKTCSDILPPRSKCSISVTFAPTAKDLRQGSLSVTDSLGTTNSVSLTGTGTQVDLSPSAVDFGAVAVGSTATQNVTLHNVGPTGLTLLGLTVAPKGTAFSIANTDCGSVVPADSRCTITLTFAPTVQTTQTASLKVRDDGGASPQTVPLTGVGGNPVPTLSSLSPHKRVAGSGRITLTLTGTNFLAGSVVQWNGSARPTVFVSGTELRAKISAADLAFPGTAAVAVFNPPPAGGLSNPLVFTIFSPNPVPTLNFINPSSLPAGGGGFTLAVNGFNFVSRSVVRWNGSNRPTVFLDSNDLQAQIPASDIANMGTAQISVFNPAPGGGTSNSLTFTITLPVTITTLNLTANDLAWDPYNRQIYASVPSAAGANGNSITIIDPFAGTIGASTFAGSEPSRIGLSDDSQFLYVGLNGSASVQRMVVPALALDINIPLGSDPFFGPYFALDLQVAPRSPHTTAIALANVGVSPSEEGGVPIFDDGTPRPNKLPGFSGTGDLFDSLQWGADATALYAANNEDTGFDFYTITVDKTGAKLNHDYFSAFSSFGNTIHFDSGTGLIYSDDGHIIDPSNGSQSGSFSASGRMVPDSTLGRAFFVGTDFQNGSLAISAFDLTRFTQLGVADLTGINPEAFGSLIRWGQSGLAFRTINFDGTGQVILVSSPLILPVSPTDNPVPAASSLAPSSATAGGPNFQLTVSGTNFVQGSVVRWNGQDRTTKYISSTQLIAYIPASDIATPQTASVTVFNPAPAGGTSNPLSFTINP